VRQQLENERRADLVGDVGDADVEKGQLNSHDIARNQHELVGVLRVFEPLGELGDHARVELNCDHLLRSLQ